MSNSPEFTAKEKEQIADHGLNEDQVKAQIKTFKDGIENLKVEKAATPEDGIVQLDDVERSVLHDGYIIQDDVEVAKFIPASGAASRMFKALHQLKAELDESNKSLSQLLKAEDHKALKPFFDRFEEYAFAEQALSMAKKEHPNLEKLSKDEKHKILLDTVLDEDKLGLAELPKGLIPFHRYADETLTPFEEHFHEASYYASYQNKAHLHFTVTDDHLARFKQVEDACLPALKQETDLDYFVHYTFQERSTDTIAVNPDNSIFKLENGELLFRPAGHGALIKNLNKIDADLIFIKNIDNVQRKETAKDNASYKRALAGKLLEVQREAHHYLNGIVAGLYIEIEEEIKTFIRETLLIKGEVKDKATAYELLNRPIRICGMVKNEGAPGGGPFWVKLDNGFTTLQIVETSQMDLSDEGQRSILEHSTHFNPVDIVCGVKDFEGRKFDLEKYVNPKRGIITEKSAEGKPLKALELPGLWNGAMEHWNTIFVEVPLQTFSPVKTVLDLLNEAHQG
jgi:hypothetical protein